MRLDPAITGLISMTVTGASIGLALYAVDYRVRVIAFWCGVSYWMGAMLEAAMNNPGAPQEKPQPYLDPSWQRMATGRALIPTNDEHTEAWSFDVTQAQWQALAERLASGTATLPINPLSGDGMPFTQAQIETLREDLVRAGLAHRVGSNRVVVNERGQWFVMMQSQRPTEKLVQMGRK